MSFRKARVRTRATLASVMFALAAAPSRGTQVPVKVYGIDFSPYLTGQNPNLGSQVTSAQILARMQVIAPYTSWVRSFGSTGGLENTPAVARQLGLKVAANAWISTDLSQNEAEIANLIAAADAGLVDVAIVGSEAILRGDVTVAQLIAYMNQVRAAIPGGIPVTTADVWGTFIANPSLVAASDQVWANFYPYWEGTSINNAVCSLEQEYQQLVSASGAKPVVVSETGWPSAGNAVGAAIPSAANAASYALQLFTWASANKIQSFYFEAFNEDWKTASEGPQGANWGIWDENAVIKPGMDQFFNGLTSGVSCNGQIPGQVGIAPVYVPPYGSFDAMEVQVTGVQPNNFVIAAFINVNGGWWTKPTFAQPTVAINADGTAKIAIVTGGLDYDAIEVEAFLVPAGSNPPAASGGGKPSLPNAVASFDVSRTQSSISGTITDSQGNPIAGAVVNDPVLGSATSAPDGKYSFYDITTTGTATLSVTYPNYVFPQSPATVAILSGNQPVNFTGTPTVDLSVAASISQNPVLPGSNLVATVVVSNAGPASAPDASLTLSIPASFSSVNISTTQGSCNTSAQPVKCGLGTLAATAYGVGGAATVTVNAIANSAGSYTFGASVTGPSPDSNLSNNATSLNVTVLALQNITFGTLPNQTLSSSPPR
jgi:exo-beta-1,3-glucanase (GH17 family)